MNCQNCKARTPLFNKYCYGCHAIYGSETLEMSNNDYVITRFKENFGVWIKEPNWRKCQPIEIFVTKDQAIEYTKGEF